MSQTAELLDDTVFKHQNVVEFERGVVMTVGVECDDWQADFFGKYANGLVLIFGLLLLGVRIGDGECQQEKTKCTFKKEHGLKPDQSRGLHRLNDAPV